MSTALDERTDHDLDLAEHRAGSGEGRWFGWSGPADDVAPGWWAMVVTGPHHGPPARVHEERAMGVTLRLPWRCAWTTEPDHDTAQAALCREAWT